ncbi:hypothetical protein M5K25_013976 [Dendrobium thyrsiflorum]|uniref:Uncharacterized protein n=1 Tax=Dendrobium thyrsiflorum TaxID=117978 RepID=A0ABD0UUE1_DENTH
MGKANRQQPTGNRAREDQQGTGRPTGSSPQETGHGKANRQQPTRNRAREMNSQKKQPHGEEEKKRQIIFFIYAFCIYELNQVPGKQRARSTKVAVACGRSPSVTV